jgi:curli biogenesis system outer membrane secretion channel CsgG
MDNETSLINSRSLASGTGFIAAYVYAKVRLVNAETLNVVREVSVKESDLNINYSVSSANLAAWNAITTEQKVTRLNEVIDGAIGDAVTKLLKP